MFRLRYLGIGILLLIFTVTSWGANTGKIIAVKDVSTYTSQTVTVEGKVLRVGLSKNSTTYFLNFTQERGGFSVVIFKSVAEQFAKEKIDIKSYEGKTVRVTGKIDNHPTYGIQIILDKPSSVSIVKTEDTTNKTSSDTKSSTSSKVESKSNTSSEIIKVADVKEHAGSTGTVEGKVIRVGKSNSGTTYFLNFTQERGGFTVVIFKSVAEQFTKSKLDINSYSGKTVQVTGKIEDDPQYGIQIKLDKPENIKILK